MSVTETEDLAFPVHVRAPDLSPWLAGNTGIAGFHQFTGPTPGPHVGIIALIHGNEIAGAIALERLLRSAPRPRAGRLTLGFANLAAFASFDPARPTASRFLDEDMNRVWDRATLHGNRSSRELDRARAILPIIETMDVLLDLHSMLWPSDPLFLCGTTARGRDLAMRLGAPPLVVADDGHASGRRLIDADRFADPAGQATAILLEAGQHWQTDSIDLAHAVVHALLGLHGLADAAETLFGAPSGAPAGAPMPASAPRFARVTRAVTATTSQFSFVRPFRGGEIIAAPDTLIATDGPAEIRTPHENCLLVMPSLRASRGHTAVRLARLYD